MNDQAREARINVLTSEMRRQRPEPPNPYRSAHVWVLQWRYIEDEPQTEQLRGRRDL